MPYGKGGKNKVKNNRLAQGDKKIDRKRKANASKAIQEESAEAEAEAEAEADASAKAEADAPAKAEAYAPAGAEADAPAVESAAASQEREYPVANKRVKMTMKNERTVA
jgi:hypothetical protein